ncbi:outer membrane protein assembly factor BamD [Leptolyngbya sp. 7M]|uniref:outer membrane protein assembly factor BamD n=1 Tax=Leptolyngbya sp. 7M TaxID=2812896 RepID=UPI001B8D57BD|nr:outer membrane protein assembly factor BamD [Leptolyngbya sp. 7M]QYO66093.1 outer membrane protein assembly factor BamD [Leptolyngbya sp. 7M]
MKFRYSRLLSSIFVLTLAASTGFSQVRPGDGTLAQRLEVMKQKLETVRRSASSSISVLREEGEGDKAARDNPDSALNRLRSIEKEASGLQSEVNNLRGRIDRAEKYEASDVDQLEQRVADLQSRAERVLVETAAARANPTSTVGQPRQPKKKKKFLGIFGGGGTDEYDELIGSVSPGRDRELFVVATREIRKKNFDVGRLLFQTIVTTYPDSPYLPMSKLAIADSFFLEGSTSALIQAIAAYQDWLTFFPTHPLADRVVMKIAESEMRQIGLPDRDVTRAKRAEVRLKALLQNYPNSILKPDAEKRLIEVQDNIGMHNLLIANYYYTQSVGQGKGGLKGAQSRYLEILEKYPNFGNMDEALFKLANTYLVEEETDQAARYFQRIVSDYPNSEYLAKSKEQLGLIGASIPEPNPERMNVLPPEKESFFRNFRNQLFGIYPMTIDKDGVLMTRNFDREKFELIDQIIENQGDILVNQIPQAFTTVISQRQAQVRPNTAQPRTDPER